MTNTPRTAYVTIDDSPSVITPALLAYLDKHAIPALIFGIGQKMAAQADVMIRAIQQGCVIGNHSHTHTPAAILGYDGWVADFEACEAVIDGLYAQAGVARPGLYYRFPYIDRGDGDRMEWRFDDLIQGASLPQPEAVARIQAYLKARGFRQPFAGVTHPLYQAPAIVGAADCLFTYTTKDWMLTARHLGQHGDVLTVADLVARMDADPYLLHEPGPQVVLLHDQPDLGPVAIGLIAALQARCFRFIDIPHA